MRICCTSPQIKKRPTGEMVCSFCSSYHGACAKDPFYTPPRLMGEVTFSYEESRRLSGKSWMELAKERSTIKKQKWTLLMGQF